MTEPDAPAVSDIRVRSWQAAYAGLVPQDYLDAMSVTADTARRRQLFTAADRVADNLVAESGEQLVGWASVGPCRDADVPLSAGEVWAMYAPPEQWGRGVGRALMTAALDRLRSQRRQPVYLKVLVGNDRARRFYERAGFRIDRLVEPFEVGGAALPEVRYIRDDT
jgi:GNAT superfamily N-acetyltransferase